MEGLTQLKPMEDLCLLLKTYYNADFIPMMNNITVSKSFKSIAKKYKRLKKGNVALIGLIYNLYHGKMIKSNKLYISGPMSITYQTSQKYDKKIYIFGEYHGKINDCTQVNLPLFSRNMDISEYLHRLFDTTTKFIDFYIEDELFRLLPSDRKHNFLHMLRHDFNNCLNPTLRKKCKWPYVRTHFVDARMIQLKSQIYIEGTNQVQNLVFELMHDNRGSLDKYNSILKRLSSLKTHEQIARYLIEIALSIPIVKKELKRSDLGTKKIISTLIPIVTKIYSNTFDINVWSSPSWFNWEDLKNKYILLVNFLTPLVDIYTIARMFKTFRKSEQMPSRPHYIIYYAGNSHSNITRTFLDMLGFTTHVSRFLDNRNIRCLPMKGIDLDFK